MAFAPEAQGGFRTEGVVNYEVIDGESRAGWGRGVYEATSEDYCLNPIDGETEQD